MSWNPALSRPVRRWAASHTATWLLLSLMVVLLVLVRLPEEAIPGGTVVLWAVLAMLAERLWCLARDGRHRHKAAPFVHVAAVLLLPLPLAVSINVVSALLGSRFFRGHWCKAYPAFVAAASLAAGGIFWLARDARGHLAVEVAVWVLAGAVYHAVYQSLVTQATFRRRGLSWGAAWKENYGHPTEYVAVTAMIVVSVMAVLSAKALGAGGVCLAVIPAYFVWDGWRRYLELEQTQRRLIDAERLSAKGEMAGEIGHELNNYLAAIGGRAQLMAMDRNIPEDMAEEVERVREAAMRMADLAKGLMDMSQREAKVERFNIAPFIHQILDVVRPQARFVGVQLDADVDTPAYVTLDPGLFQQILVTLLRRSVVYGPHGEPRHVTLTTGIREGKTKTCIEIIRSKRDLPLEESHPQAIRLRGGDREIAGVRRMVERHGGLFAAQSDEEGREGYRIILPLATEA